MIDENFETKAQDLLKALGEFLGLGTLEFDAEDDTCTLVLDDTIEVNVTPNAEDGTLILHHLVGTLLAENREEILERLLEANFFWAGTQGATVSFERESSTVFIMRALFLYDAMGELLTGEALGKSIADLASAAVRIRSIFSAPTSYTF